MTQTLIGQSFDQRHAAGVTTYRVDRRHRDAGYYECVATAFQPQPPFKATDFVGSIQVFSGADIQRALDDEAEDAGLAWAAEGETVCRW